MLADMLHRSGQGAGVNQRSCLYIQLELVSFG